MICILYYLKSNSRSSAPAPVSDIPHPPSHDTPVLDSDQVILEPEHPPSPPSPPSSKVEEDSKFQGVIGGVEDVKEEKSSAEKPIGESDKTKGDSSNTYAKSEKTDKGKSTASKEDDKFGQTKSGSGKGSAKGKDDDGDDSTPAKSKGQSGSSAVANHPIDELIRLANKNFKEVLAKESTTLTEAAEAYRKRRGRHPPPGFDKWFEFAQENDAIIVEDFFDRIYHDLNPFWGLDPNIIRKESWDFEMTINIRNHNASAKSDWFWTQIWLKMFKTIEHLLPDMDVALNAMDEPRLVVPWEEVATYMQKAERTRKLTPVDKVVSTFQERPDPEEGYKKPVTRKKKWEETSKATFFLVSISCAGKEILTPDRPLLVDCTSWLPPRQPSSPVRRCGFLR